MDDASGSRLRPILSPIDAGKLILTNESSSHLLLQLVEIGFSQQKLKARLFSKSTRGADAC